jgi:3'-phosphoadenosine 5'-phosphosulfate sulfotransferase (PAPS reductase)/FAD synthetase
MDLAKLTKIITPYFKGSFELPKAQNPDNELLHIVGVSSGIDSTATALCLKVLFPTIPFKFVFTDTQWEVDGTLSALRKIEHFLGESIIYLSAPHGLLEQIEMNGGYIPSQRNRFCTGYQKIKPFQQFIDSLKTRTNNGNVEVANYTGIRADEPTREGAQFSGDTSNNFPLQALGLNKEDVNNIVNQTVGIPLYYMDKSRSGCKLCIYARRSEVIDAWANEPVSMERAAVFEVLPQPLIDTYKNIPESVAKALSISRNWMGYVRPDWIGYPKVGSQSNRGKKQRSETMDLFSEQAKDLYVAVEYLYHKGIPGMALPQIYREKIITYSTSLGGLKLALKHFWLHRLQTKELHDLVDPTNDGMIENKQIAIIQVEVDDFNSLVPEKPHETFTWQSDKKPLLAIRKTVAILDHILLCEGLRQDGNKQVENLSKEYGRVLNFAEYNKPAHEDLVDDIDIEDSPVICNVCSR